MKLFKKISALIAAVSIFGATVLANDLMFDEKLEYAANAEKVTVNVYTTQPDVGEWATLGVQYDNTVYTLNKAECTSMGTAIEFNDEDFENIITWAAPNGVEGVTAASPLFTLVFDVIEGKSPVGTTFLITEQCGDTSWIYNANGDDYTYEDVSITVTGNGPNYPTVTDEADNTRYVVIEEMGATTANPASRLYATYLGEVKSSNLYRLLGIDSAANTTVNFDSITVKMILPVGDEYPAAEDYSFDIAE